MAVCLLIGDSEGFKRLERVKLGSAGLFQKIEQPSRFIQPTGADMAPGDADARLGQIRSKLQRFGVVSTGFFALTDVFERSAEISLDLGVGRVLLRHFLLKIGGLSRLMKFEELLVSGNGCLRRGGGTVVVHGAG